MEHLDARRLLAISTWSGAGNDDLWSNPANWDVVPVDGIVTLREAIFAANANNDSGDPDITAQNSGAFGASDTIQFNTPGSGVHTIALVSRLPAITDPATIDGCTKSDIHPLD